METKPKNQYDTLVLSGEAINGVVTLGALQYLYDKNKLNDIKTYIGTSSGSMCGYLLSIGYTPIEILIYLEKNKVFSSISTFNIITLFKGEGCVEFTQIIRFLEDMTIKKLGYVPTLLELHEKLGKTFIVTTYNLSEQKTEYVSFEVYPHLSCIQAIQMSSSIPIVFNNCVYKEKLYADGAISNNFPINIVKKNQCPIGIYIMPRQVDVNITYVSFVHKILHVIQKLIQINTELRVKSIKKEIRKNIFQIEMTIATSLSSPSLNMTNCIRFRVDIQKFKIRLKKKQT